MDWLARREYSRDELQRKLEDKLFRFFPDATAAIGPVLDQLEHEGLLSTARFLDVFTRSQVRKGYGPRRIRDALRSKGITAETLAATEAAATNDEHQPVDWLAQAREVRSRKFGEALPPGPAERNRQMAFLMRRGFPSDICRKACLPPRDE